MTTRQLTSTEREQAHLVFSDSLNYDRVRVIEEVAWPNWIARIGAWISRTQPPAMNAVTLGNRINFPRRLRTDASDVTDAFVNDMTWLIHELTHVWQYQQVGIVYLFQALRVQITLGQDAYSYGWEHGLVEAKNLGKGFGEYNREQQGDIAGHYYYRQKKGFDTSAWDPFIDEVRLS